MHLSIVPRNQSRKRSQLAVQQQTTTISKKPSHEQKDGYAYAKSRSDSDSDGEDAFALPLTMPKEAKHLSSDDLVKDVEGAVYFVERVGDTMERLQTEETRRGEFCSKLEHMIAKQSDELDRLKKSVC